MCSDHPPTCCMTCAHAAHCRWLGACCAAGWGYAGGVAALRAATAVKHPTDDGLWLIDTQSGASRLLVSLQALFQATFSGAQPRPRVLLRSRGLVLHVTCTRRVSLQRLHERPCTHHAELRAATGL
jgi:hypothetical protein